MGPYIGTIQINSQSIGEIVLTRIGFVLLRSNHGLVEQGVQNNSEGNEMV